MHTDPIADMLTRLRNGSKAEKETVLMPFSKIKFAICELLKKNRFISDYEKTEDENKHPLLMISLNTTRPKLSIRRISKPGQRIYVKHSEVRRVKNGYGLAVYSTSKGLVTDREALKSQTGGELLFEIF